MITRLARKLIHSSRPVRFFSSNKILIENCLASNLGCRVLIVKDESASHFEAHDSHFSVYIASDDFKGQILLKRHRLVQGILKEEGIMDKIHALSMVTHTEEQLEKQKPELAQEYPCLGGGRWDKED